MNLTNYKSILGIAVLATALSAVGYFVYISTSDDRVDRDNGSPNDRQGISDKDDLIRVYSPSSDQTIESPFVIKGEARGSWYFEATFPVVLVDWDGLVIAESYAQAKGEWMTQDFVPFEATLEFENPTYGNRGMLIFQKSNPSGLPEHDDALEVAIKFKIKSDDNDSGRERDGCIITGCSNHVCAEEEVITTCEYVPEYECYKTAVCERQNDGKCGWTTTEELHICVEDSK